MLTLVRAEVCILVPEAEPTPGLEVDFTQGRAADYTRAPAAECIRDQVEDCIADQAEACTPAHQAHLIEATYLHGTFSWIY